MIEVVLYRELEGLRLAGFGPGLEVAVEKHQMPSCPVPSEFESIRATLCGEIPDALLDAVIQDATNSLFRSVKTADEYGREHGIPGEPLLDLMAKGCRLLFEHIGEERGLSLDVGVKVSTLQSAESKQAEALREAFARVILVRDGDRTSVSGCAGSVGFRAEEPYPFSIPCNLNAMRLDIDGSDLASHYSTRELQISLLRTLLDGIGPFLKALDANSKSPAEDAFLEKVLPQFSEAIGLLIHAGSSVICVPRWCIQRVGCGQFEVLGLDPERTGTGSGGKMDRQRVPLMSAPGYDIEPFVPPYEWIGQTIMQFYAPDRKLRQKLGGGRMSFTNDVFGIYRFPDVTVNFGLSAGKVLETSARMVRWEYATDTIDGVSVVSAEFDHGYLTECDIDVFGTTCRAACLELWGVCDGKTMLTSGMDQINFYLLWLGKRGQQRVAFHHPSGEWIG